MLPSIGNEVLKAEVAKYQAEQLLTQVGWVCAGDGGGEDGVEVGCVLKDHHT